MADGNFGLRIGIEGEKQFKQALADINRSFKVLASEMNLVASQFDKNDKSIQALASRKQVLTKEITAQKDKIATLEAAHKNAADSFDDAIKAGLSAIVDMVKAVGSAIGDFVGKMVIQGGFDRAMNIEQAQFKLKGLGHDAESVDAIMKDALASVKGTAYGLGDAATVAASAVAAGIQPGENLERTLKLVADASAISGRTMDEMGAIFNKVATSNKVTGREVI